MTKADIVSEISKQTGIEKRIAQEVVVSFMTCVKDSMTKGQNVYLRGFGSFILKTRAEKVARDISKNTAIVVPEHQIPAFKPAKSFLKKVKG